MPVVKNRQDNYVKMRDQGIDGNNYRTNTARCNHGREKQNVWKGPREERLPCPLSPSSREDRPQRERSSSHHTPE